MKGEVRRGLQCTLILISNLKVNLEINGNLAELLIIISIINGTLKHCIIFIIYFFVSYFEDL